MKRRAKDAALVADYKNGMSWKELQEKYECSVTTVYDILVRNGIQRKRYEEKAWPEEKVEKFKKMYLENCTYKELRETFGISDSHVTWYVHKFNLPMRGSGRNNVYENKFAARTPEADFWLGYFFADGHLECLPNRRNWGISIFSEKDYVVFKFSEWFGMGVRVYTKEYTTKDGVKHTMYNARIGSKVIAKWFHDVLGITPNKHHTLNPKINLTWNLLRGYFEGDGSVNKKYEWQLKSCSKVWLDRIQSFLSDHGIKSTLRLSYRDCYGLYVYSLKSQKRLFKYLYEYPYYCHEYKYQALANRVAAMPQCKSGELLEA